MAKQCLKWGGYSSFTQLPSLPPPSTSTDKVHLVLRLPVVSTYHNTSVTPLAHRHRPCRQGPQPYTTLGAMSLPIPTASNAATSPSTRFTPLSTHFLNAQPPNSETTLSTLIAQSEQLAEEAREALPYSFDECSYKRGYIRQSVWSCLDCGRGVCYGCSISCHGGESVDVLS